MIKILIASSDPAAMAAFWEPILGDFEPPCRRHPDVWMGSYLGSGVVIAPLAGREPGYYLACDGAYLEQHDWGTHGGVAVDCQDAACRAVLDPDGNRIPLARMDRIPVKLRHYAEELAIRLLLREFPVIDGIMKSSGLRDPRLIDPDSYARQGDSRGPFRLVVSGDGDLGELETLLSGLAERNGEWRHRMTTVRDTDLPAGLRSDVDKLATWLAEPSEASTQD